MIGQMIGNSNDILGMYRFEYDICHTASHIWCLFLKPQIKLPEFKTRFKFIIYLNKKNQKHLSPSFFSTLFVNCLFWCSKSKFFNEMKIYTCCDPGCDEIEIYIISFYSYFVSWQYRGNLWPFTWLTQIVSQTFETRFRLFPTNDKKELVWKIINDMIIKQIQKQIANSTYFKTVFHSSGIGLCWTIFAAAFSANFRSKLAIGSHFSIGAPSSVDPAVDFFERALNRMRKIKFRIFQDKFGKMATRIAMDMVNARVNIELTSKLHSIHLELGCVEWILQHPFRLSFDWNCRVDCVSSIDRFSFDPSANLNHNKNRISNWCWIKNSL